MDLTNPQEIIKTINSLDSDLIAVNCRLVFEDGQWLHETLYDLQPVYDPRNCEI